MTITTIGGSGAQSAGPPPTAPPGTGTSAASATVVVAKQAPQPQPKPEQVQQAIESMKRMIEAKTPNSLAFSVDDSSGRTIVRITDAQTGETIRQIPSQEMLDIARSIDKMQGMLLKSKA